MKRLLLSTLAACALLATALADPSLATPTAAATAQTAHRAPPKDTTAPGPVTGLTVSGNTLHSISLTWSNPENADLAHILIRRAVGDEPPLSASDGTLVAVLGSHATEFTDRKLDSGTTYSYAVYASDRQQNLSAPSTVSALTLTTNDRTGVRGVLTDKQGNPIAGAVAQARTDGGDYAGEATTGADGSYRIANLQPGTYAVCFETTAQTKGPSSTGYISGCYRQRPFGYGGTPVTVTAGKMTTGVNDYLSVGGAISGRITDPSGAGIGDVSVYVAYPYPQHSFYSATSSADGSYTIKGLPADTYRICFDAGHATGAVSTGYLSECYENLPSWDGESGTDIPVRLGHTTPGINATLTVAGALTGKVTDPAGNPVRDLTAFLIPGGLGITDAQGVYRIIGIDPGTYSVCVDGADVTSPTAPYGYLRDCGPDFEVVAGQTATQRHTVQIAGALGGSVSGPDGSPVAGVWTTLYDSAGVESTATLTDESGNWQVPGLSAGRYTVCYDPTFSGGGFRRACYDGKPYGATTGTPVTVTAAQLTTVNQALVLGATIRGAVTDSNGGPLAVVGVSAVSLAGGTGYSTYASTDYQGNYTLTGLDPGSYAVCFDASYASGPSNGGYSSECYDNQPSADTADPVVVGDASAVRIDAMLAGGAAITGRVTDPNGGGVSSVRVVATSTTSGRVSASTNPDGSYEVVGLQRGDYTVCFYPTPSSTGPDTGYAPECWQDQQVSLGGTPVHVDSSAIVSGVDPQLGLGAAVTGTVTAAADGTPLQDVYVDVRGTDGHYYDPYGTTDTSGRYTVIGLPAIPLVVCFWPYTYMDPFYLPQCYRNAPDETSGTAVTPTPGEFTSGVDAVLQIAPW